jgi:hypothetical protein
MQRNISSSSYGCVEIMGQALEPRGWIIDYIAKMQVPLQKRIAGKVHSRHHALGYALAIRRRRNRLAETKVLKRY